MALKNRTESKAVIDAWAAILDLEADHKPDLQTVLDNCIFRKDVATSTTASGTTKTLEFLNVDYIEVTQTTANVDYTLNNIQQGEIKYLKIIMLSAISVTFANANNQAYDQNYLNSLDEILYVLINKDGTILAIPLMLDMRIATTSEAKNLTDDIKLMSPKKVGDITGGLLTKVVEIGDWDMDATMTISVAHGIDHTKIRNINVILRRDDETFFYNIFFSAAGVSEATIAKIDSTHVFLERQNGSIYDGANFDLTSFNRGWITIQYVP